MTGKLAPRLMAAGVSAELSERCATFLDSLIAARYGGLAHSAASASARELLTELDAVRWSDSAR